MKHLRVLILCDGKVVDIHDLEDPRLRYIVDFNQLNSTTPYEAVLEETAPPDSAARHANRPSVTPAAAKWRQGCCSQLRRCRR